MKVKATGKDGGNVMGEYMGTAEASKKWGWTPAKITDWCRRGKVPGAEQDKKGSPWRIPADACMAWERKIGEES